MSIDAAPASQLLTIPEVAALLKISITNCSYRFAIATSRLTETAKMELLGGLFFLARENVLEKGMPFLFIRSSPTS